MNKYFAYKKEGITSQEMRHAALARQAAAEGMVLLENKGGLPCKTGEKLALFGDGARQTLICGLGAASMNYRTAVSVEEGLERAGFVITSKDYLAKAALMLEEETEKYYEWLRGQSREELLQGVFAMYANPFVPSRQKRITEEDIRVKADTAVFVISRNSGEGADRKNIPGDYQLLEDEVQNLMFLDEHFESVIVLLNTIGVIDTKFIRGLKHLKAMLFMGLGGSGAGNAVADIFLGKVPPQGKLTSTWAENYEDYPNALTYAEVNGDVDDEMYTEGIYVGYRYFDSYGITPAYPFGYGMTYAEFSITLTGCEQKGRCIQARAEVRNLSREFAGREVVQAYVSPPTGRLHKPYQSLAGYAKTEMLEPGQQEEVMIELDIKSMASYDEKAAAWVLEAGDYLIRLGSSSRDTKPSGIIRIGEEILLEQCRNLFPLDTELDEWKTETAAGREELDEAEKSCVLNINVSDFETTIHQYRNLEKVDIHTDIYQGQNTGDGYPAVKGRTLTLNDVREGRISLDELAAQLSVDEMAKICVGNVPEEHVEVNRASVMAAGTAVRTAAGNEDYMNPVVPGASETTGALQSGRRIPKLNLADGGSGLRLVAEFETDGQGELLTSGLFSIRGVDRIAKKVQGCRQYEGSELYFQYTTALPMAVILAQTWDTELLGRCGEMIGRELVTFGVDLWLAPSMNIHRNPLCGRNFEYYSEDPLITGICGSTMVHGVEMYRGTGATIKHLACNNQEANRGATNAHVSERALREIYLRGYEMAIRKEKPVSMMTSLNLINGIHAANNYDMLTSFARDECGFDGFVMTDWGTTVADASEDNKYPCSSVAGCLTAGNDLIMPGTSGDVEGIRLAVQNGEVKLWQLQECVKNILRGMLKMDKSVGDKI